MADKYIALDSGQLTEVEATVESVGAEDAGEIVALDSSGRLDDSVMPVGIVPEVKICPAKEALVAGNLINLFSDEGTLKARKADCSNSRPAHGFILSSFDQDADATVYLEGNNTGVSGKTIGAVQYLSTAGATTETAPSDSGYIVQEIGIAVSAMEITFELQKPITLA